MDHYKIILKMINGNDINKTELKMAYCFKGKGRFC